MQLVDDASTSLWRAFDKNGVQVLLLSTYTPVVCNTGTMTCSDIFQAITKPLIVMCFTVNVAVFQYSRPVVINIQGII